MRSTRGWAPERRPHRLMLRLSEVERADLLAAGERAGMATAAWVAATAVAVARGEVALPLPAGRREVLAELLDAHLAVARFGVNVNQAVARLHSTGEVGPQLAAAVEACTRATEGLDAAVRRVSAMRS